MITQEFISYIKNALAEGHTKESLKGSLLGAGWMPADIEEVFKIVVPPAQGPVPLTPKGPIPMPIPTPMIKPVSAPAATPPMSSSPVTPTPAPSMPSSQMASPVMPKMGEHMPTMPAAAPKAPEPVRPPAPMASPVTPPASTSVSMPSMQNKPVTPATPATPVPLMPKPSSMPSQMVSKPMPNFNGMPMETPVIKKSNSGLLTIFIIFFLLGGVVFAGWYLYRPQIEKLLGMAPATEDTSNTTQTPVATQQPEVPAPAPADQTVVNIPAPTEQPSATPTPTPTPTPAPDAGNATYSNSYKGNGFSFNYDTNATQTTTTGSLGTYHLINVSGGKYPDSLYFFRGAVPDSVNPCKDATVKTTTINNKTFTYCDNTQGGENRSYIYNSNGESMLVTVTTSSTKPETGYVDLGSLVIQ